VCGCALQDRTIFTGVSLLLPPSAWVCAPGQPGARNAILTGRRGSPGPLPADEYYEALKATSPRFYRAIFKAAEGGPVADRRAGQPDDIAGVARRPALPCYTFGGM